MPILSVETIKITNKRETQKKTKTKTKTNKQTKKQKRTRGTKAIVKG